MKKKPSKSGRVAVIARAREAQCISLRKEGLSYRLISQQVGITEQGVMKAIRRVMTRVAAQTGADVEDIKSIELERLDDMHAAIFPDAKSGNLKAVDRVLKIMERRSAYLGLDAPRKLEADIHTDDLDSQIATVLEKLKLTCQVSTQVAVISTPKSIDSGG